MRRACVPDWNPKPVVRPYAPEQHVERARGRQSHAQVAQPTIVAQKLRYYEDLEFQGMFRQQAG